MSEFSLLKSLREIFWRSDETGLEILTAFVVAAIAFSALYAGPGLCTDPAISGAALPLAMFVFLAQIVFQAHSIRHNEGQ